MYSDDLDYAKKRLNGTLVRKTEGSPFLVQEVVKEGDTTACLGTDLTTSEFLSTPLDEIDLTPVPLGFANHGDKMSFFCRRPLRRDWKQGLSTGNVVIYGEAKRDFNWNMLTNTILNKFPKLDEVIHYVKKGSARSKAFSRDFGLSSSNGDTLLVYRKFVVGRLDGGNLVLNRDKFFLEEHLRESVGA